MVPKKLFYDFDLFQVIHGSNRECLLLFSVHAFSLRLPEVFHSERTGEKARHVKSKYLCSPPVFHMSIILRILHDPLYPLLFIPTILPSWQRLAASGLHRHFILSRGSLSPATFHYRSLPPVMCLSSGDDTVRPPS